MKFQQLHPRDQLVNIMHRIYQQGMTTLSGGNLSIKDNHGDLWITPASVDKGRLTADDIVQVRASGESQGRHRPSSELPFHRAIYAGRPDLGAIVHAHAPALVAFSLTRRIPDTSLIPQAERVCGSVGYAPYALPGSGLLGENIAAAFARGCSTVLLENHGAAAAGPDLLTAFQRLETLEFYARTLLKAHTLGAVTRLSQAERAHLSQPTRQLPEFDPGPPGSQESELRVQLVDIMARAYNRFLITSAAGAASARLDEQRFLITPSGLDRASLEVEDIVLIDDDRRAAGQPPPRSVELHRAIYDRHPHIQALITAQPPHATAFAISGMEFDSHTIPESYILLRDVPRLPFGPQYTAPEQVAERISSQVPVLLIQNEGVLTTGDSLLQAFDRLEVLEYSARALLDTAAIGPVQPISTDDIGALEQAYPI
jgi:L-fuculose-phosphate aldolase